MAGPVTDSDAGPWTQPVTREMRAITLNRVAKTFDGVVEAIRCIDLQIKKQEIYCLLGPSGCGKTTVLNMVAGFERPTAGEILVEGSMVTGPGPDRAVVFQQPTLYPWQTVLQNISFGLRVAGVSSRDAKAQAMSYVGAIGLEGFEERYPYELSGGMQQRVALARAWINTPRVLLLDEPFGALDAQTKIVMQELLLDIWGRVHTTILYITHDVEEAIFLGDRIGIMTQRPALLRAELEVNLRRPRTSTITTDDAFVKLKKEILNILKEKDNFK